MCFETAPFFEPVASSCSVAERRERGADLLGRRPPTCSSSRGVSLRSSRIAALRTSSRIFFESSVVICADELDEHPADELARVLERREHLLLGPGREPAGPEVVVLVEALVLALGEVRAPAREALLERGELLVAVDVDALDLGLDLVLEVVEVLRARLDVDAA